MAALSVKEDCPPVLGSRISIFYGINIGIQ